MLNQRVLNDLKKARLSCGLMQCCGPGMFIPDPNFLPKNLSLSSKIYGFGIRDPRSGIRNRSKKAPDSGSATLVLWFSSIPTTPSPRLPSASCLFLSVFLYQSSCRPSLLRGGRPQESLALYKSFNTLWRVPLIDKAVLVYAAYLSCFKLCFITFLFSIYSFELSFIQSWFFPNSLTNLFLIPDSLNNLPLTYWLTADYYWPIIIVIYCDTI